MKKSKGGLENTFKIVQSVVDAFGLGTLKGRINKRPTEESPIILASALVFVYKVNLLNL
jgi:hypothetical protein